MTPKRKDQIEFVVTLVLMSLSTQIGMWVGLYFALHQFFPQ